MRWRVVGRLVWLGFVVVAGTGGCAARDASPAVAAPPPSPAAQPAAEAAPMSVPVAPAAEAGFVACCGSQSFRLDIRCEDQLMRCYRQQAGDWVQTYGRHCERALGDACYLRGCDNRCR